MTHPDDLPGPPTHPMQDRQARTLLRAAAVRLAALYALHPGGEQSADEWAGFAFRLADPADPHRAPVAVS